MRKCKGLVLLLWLVIMALLIGPSCSLGVKQGFLVTQETFNDMVTNYHAYYKAAPPDEQKDLKANVHPKVIEALGLLTGINEAIRLGVDPAQIDKDRFKELRYKLYKKLPEIFNKEG